MGVVRRIYDWVQRRVMQPLYSWTCKILFEEKTETAGPFTKKGIECERPDDKRYDGVELATDYQVDRRPERLGPSTAIVTGKWALWEIELPKDVRKHLRAVNLRIGTVRTHGMLHTPIKNRGKTGTIFINNQRVDQIRLVKPHPHGEDLGVDSRRPWPVIDFVDKGTPIQSIRIETDDEVSWDIDEVALEAVVFIRRLRQWVWMTIGALFSAIAGTFLPPLLRLLFPWISR